MLQEIEGNRVSRNEAKSFFSGVVALAYVHGYTHPLDNHAIDSYFIYIVRSGAAALHRAFRASSAGQRLSICGPFERRDCARGGDHP